MTTSFSQLVESVLADQTTSFWFRDALSQALKRDPVDAHADAEALTQLLQTRLDTLIQSSRADTTSDERSMPKDFREHAINPNRTSLPLAQGKNGHGRAK
jgi:uncharacterized protein YggE